MKEIITNTKSRVLETDLDLVSLNIVDGEYIYTFKKDYLSAFGFGEKFDAVNQIGKVVYVSCREKCFYQGEFSYCTYPFMVSADGFGIYVDTLVPTTFDLTDPSRIIIKMFPDVQGNVGSIYFFEGSPSDILHDFSLVRGHARLFPKEVLGAWLSSNRWENDRHIQEQLDYLDKTKIPHNIMVLERWADEQTLYNFSGSQYEPVAGNDFIKYEDFSFDQNGNFKNPKKLVDDVHAHGLKLLLWDVPTLLVNDQTNLHEGYEQRKIDNAYALKHRETAMLANGEPYVIPPGNWWAGSYIPDFTNPKALEHWFNHRQYLNTLEIDGFKTDGGEFVHRDDIVFNNGLTGFEMKNRYPDLYIKSYYEHTVKDPILYSRAGYTEIAKYSILWGGDQLSTWDEYRSMIKAMLSSSFSGIPYWGFDIGGFSGPLPSKTLYLRQIQFASLIPIMQWHSDPVVNGGWDTTRAWPINDRSPWNMAEFYKDESILEKAAPYFHLHYNFVPYMYNLSLQAVRSGSPIVSHLAYHFPRDVKTYHIEDEFMLGDALLSVPVTEDYTSRRRFYLPEGKWFRFGSTTPFSGGREHEIEINDDSFILFMRLNKAIAVNLNEEMTFGSLMDNKVHEYKRLTFIYAGEGHYDFEDEKGHTVSFDFANGDVFNIKNNDNLTINFVDFEKKGPSLWPKDLLKD